MTIISEKLIKREIIKKIKSKTRGNNHLKKQVWKEKETHITAKYELGINKREEALHRDKKAKTTSAAI
jgi:hypothetical protein